MVFIGNSFAINTIAVGGHRLLGAIERRDNVTIETGCYFTVKTDDLADELYRLIGSEHQGLTTLTANGLTVDGLDAGSQGGVSQPHSGIAEDKEAEFIVIDIVQIVLSQLDDVANALGATALITSEYVAAHCIIEFTVWDNKGKPG